MTKGRGLTVPSQDKIQSCDVIQKMILFEIMKT